VKKRYTHQERKEEENRKDRKNVPVQFPDHPARTSIEDGDVMDA